MQANSISKTSGLLFRAALWAIGMLCVTMQAGAGVYLSSTSFSTSSLPSVYTDESLPQPYKLRVKFSNGYHAVTGWNNNWQTLEGVPGTGTWGVQCYWVKYASDGTTITEIGTFYNYTVNISGNTAPQTLSVSAANTSPGQDTTITGSAYDADGDLQWLQFYVSPPGYGWLPAGSTPVTGTNASGSVAYNASSNYSIGTWAVHVRAQDSTGTWDSNANMMSYFSVKYAQSVSSQSKSLYVNDAFIPVYGGGAGTGAWQFVVVGQTNWGGTQPGTILVSGATSATWTPTAAGTYTFYVQKVGDGSYLPSDPAGPYTLTVSKRSQPDASSQNATVNVGQPFTPQYSGGANESTGAWQFVVNWRTNWGGTQPGTLIGEALTPSLSWVPEEAGTYTFYVKKLGDYQYTDAPFGGPYTLTVVSAVPTITSGPQSQTIDEGQTAIFSVIASGESPLYYQWRKDGIPIDGATSATLVLPGVKAESVGTYDVRVWNVHGEDVSSPATLQVNLLPVITSSQSAVATVGSAFSYTINASNRPTSFGATNLPAGFSVNSTTGEISGMPTEARTYEVTVSASNGVGTGSAPLSLTVTAADPNADSDGDGVPNGAEALLGTNPFSSGQSGSGIGLKVNSPAQ